MDESVAEIGSDLVNLAGVTLEALDSYEGSVLDAALKPLLRQIDDPKSSIGGHDS
jgi:hypothetical protein